tara:strand:+ start:2876 stop:5164 length:2289 start_codon:yes stop_codon:yes gene_type:complete
VRDALLHILKDVEEAINIERGLSIIVTRVCMTLGTEVCSIYVTDPSTNSLFLIANEGLKFEAIGPVSLAPGEGVVGLVAERAEPVNLEQATKHERYRYFAEIGEDSFNAFLGVPLIHNRNVLGVMAIQERDSRQFNVDEESFLITLAARLAVKISHAQATGEIKALVDSNYVDRDTLFEGIAGASGIAIGTAVLMHPPTDITAVRDKKVEEVKSEIAFFDMAIEQVRTDIERTNMSLEGKLPPSERALFDAYLHMLDDAAIAGEVREKILDGQWAQGALRSVILEHTATLENMDSSYLRERAADVRELGQRVLAYLQDTHQSKEHFPEDTILIGEEVTAGMLAEIPSEQLRGIVSIKGTGSSHSAILARALGLPAVLGAVDLPTQDIHNHIVVVDGFYGRVVGNPSKALIDHYRRLMEAEHEFAIELSSIKELPCVTTDNQEINLWVNIGLTEEITQSLDRGAEGIGLFRTEIPFSVRDRFPTEEEQRVIYREHMLAFEPRPVTMRTLDIGGDKSLPYFPIYEENPFLGWRGIRITLDHPEILLSQVRAMIKANSGLECLLRIMLPMITNVSEIDEAMSLIDRAYKEILEEGYDVKKPQIGAMIEVPAAVHQARQIANAVDFLAVGSNDLTQYMLAVDRNNPRVAGLYRELHPSVIHALRDVAKVAHVQGKGIGICGELAGTPEGAVLCVGMGYDVLSMNAANLPRVKWVIRNISKHSCRRILARILRMNSAEEIKQYIGDQLIKSGLERVLPHHEMPEELL